MDIERLSGGLTPADGANPRTFPAIWNDTANDIEQLDADVTSLSGRVTTAEGDITSIDGRVTTAEGNISGLDGRVTTAEGNITVLQQGFRYAGTRYYTSSGTFAKADPLGTGDIGLRAIRVRLVGGGGGTGRTNASRASGGGSGGGYAESFITDIAGLSSSVTVTRGAGGAGATTDGTAGTDGGQSSFGTLVVADGGGRSDGFGFVNPGGAGVTGQLLIRGETGNSGTLSSVNTPSASPGGNGGASMLGFGAVGTTGGFVGAGANAFAFGGGGGGSVGQANGGAGAAGIVIVDCFV